MQSPMVWHWRRLRLPGGEVVERGNKLESSPARFDNVRHLMTIDDVILLATQAGGEKWIKTETGLQFAEKFAILLIEKYQQELLKEQSAPRNGDE